MLKTALKSVNLIFKKIDKYILTVANRLLLILDLIFV
jgi:hypothetical protein